MRRWGAIVVGLVAVATYPACSSFGEEDEQTDPTPRAEAGADVVADAPTPPGCTPSLGNDWVGCVCENAGAIRDCSHGIIGGKSACKAGVQTCAAGKWGACAGATDPGAEVCFDDADNDCNGILDNGCMGTPDVEICGAGGPSTTPFVKPSKPVYKTGETVHLFVLWNKRIDNASVMQGDGKGCTGAYHQGEVSPGATCAKAQWHASRLSIPPSFFPKGTDTVAIYLNTPTFPCTDQEQRVTFQVVIDP